MATLEQVFRDTKEISDGDGHPFEISHTKQTNKHLMGDFFRNLITLAPSNEAENPVIRGLMKVVHNASPSTHAGET